MNTMVQQQIFKIVSRIAHYNDLDEFFFKFYFKLRSIKAIKQKTNEIF